MPYISDRIERREQAITKHMAWQRERHHDYKQICEPYFRKYKDAAMPAAYYFACVGHVKSFPNYEWRAEVRADSQRQI